MHYQAIGLEINNAGTGVYELMKVAKLPVHPITTVGKIVDPRKLINDPTKLSSKPNMSKYILRLKQQHKIKFKQDSKNPYIREFLTQFSLFKQHITDSGAETFSSPGRAFDDLVLAFFMAMKLAQRWIKIVTPNHLIRRLPTWEDQELELYA